MTFQTLNGTLAGSDLTYFFVYANDVTNGLFVLTMVISFFLIVSVGSMMAQLRFSGRIRPEVSMLAGSFSTLGFAVILEQRTGLLAPQYFFVLIALTILSAVWTFMSSE